MKKAMLFLAACLLGSGAHAQPCSIANRICALPPGYTPDPSVNQPGSYQRPWDACGPVSTAVSGAIQRAFAMASPNVQRDLCTVDRIYVGDVPNMAPWASWGKWEERGRYPVLPGCPSTGCSLIGLGSAVFTSRLDALETRILTNLHISNANAKHQHLGAISNMQSMDAAVLSALAHEMGHIKFRRDRVRDSSCFSTAFLANSWANPGETFIIGWIYFGNDIGVHADATVPKAFDYRTGHAATPLELRTIYSRGFATALASMSPEEDYVETYKLSAIDARRVGVLILNIGGSPIRVNDLPTRDGIVQSKVAAGPPCF